MYKICLLFVLSSLCVFAQDKNSFFEPLTTPYNFRLFGGVGMPMGDFASTDVNIDGPGGALTGFTFGADFNYYLTSFAFLTASAAYTSCAVDEGLIRQIYNPPNGTTISASSHKIIPVLIGAGLCLDQIENFKPYMTVQAGMSVTSLPTITLKYQGLSGEINSSTSTTFTFGLGIGATLFNRIDLNIKYINTKPEYDYTTASGGESQTVKLKQQTTYLGVTVGIVL